jgi:hypothetical protein
MSASEVSRISSDFAKPRGGCRQRGRDKMSDDAKFILGFG